MPVNIHGKDYVTVNERLAEFRKGERTLGLETEIIEHKAGEYIVMKAIIRDRVNIANENLDIIVATGFAMEYRDDKKSMVNSTSYVENCETSAWGRALANFGIGIEGSVASADEVQMAVRSQPVTKKPDPKQTIADNAQAAIDRKTISNDDLEGAGHSMKEELMDKMDGEQVDKKEEIKALAEKIYSGTDENLWKAAAMVGKHALETDTDPSVVCENWTENEGVDKEGKPKFWNGKKSLDGMKNPKAHYACYKQIEGHYLAVYHPEN